MQQLLDQIDNRLAASSNWYAIQSIELDHLNCPMCSTPMVPDDPNRTPVICPACGRMNYVVTRTTAHMSLFVTPDRFE
jgi:ribosomal protein S27AE